MRNQLLSGHHKATLILCTPALIKSITPRLGRVLGPRGLMPSERRGTVTDDIATYIRRLQGTNEWKADKTGTIRSPVAKVGSYSTPRLCFMLKWSLDGLLSR